MMSAGARTEWSAFNTFPIKMISNVTVETHPDYAHLPTSFKRLRCELNRKKSKLER